MAKHLSQSLPDLAVQVSGVSRVFGSVRALDDASLTIPRNTIFGLLGSNGAGKTTLMSIIAGHDRPTAGSIDVLGQAAFESGFVAARTSFIRDNQRYPDDYTLKHVIGAARVFHENWDQDFAEQLIEQFKIPHKTVVKKFSRGQLSAIAIIVGLASRAPLTIFDEPYLGLDISARRRFYELLLEDFTQHPRTIIISTHLVEEMEAMFDQIVVLHQGRVVLDATPDQLAQQALEITGHADRVKDAVEGLDVLHLRTVGSLASAVILGEISPEQLSRLELANVTVSPAPIHDVVAAIGNSYEVTTGATSAATSTTTSKGVS